MKPSAAAGDGMRDRLGALDGSTGHLCACFIYVNLGLASPGSSALPGSPGGPAYIKIKAGNPQACKLSLGLK